MLFSALRRAVSSLFRPGIFWHLVWPTLFAMFFWSIVFFFAWVPVTDWLTTWLSSHFNLTPEGWFYITCFWLVRIAFLLLIVPLVWLTATLLVAAFGIPMMLEKVSAYDYGALQKRHGGSNLGSVWNAVRAGSQFFGLLVISLPLWLIPGMGLIIGIGLSAWLNLKAFGYDALMLHADREELAALPRRHRDSLFIIGTLSALLAYIPLLNLFAPALCGLTFVHYLLTALETHRQEQNTFPVQP